MNLHQIASAYTGTVNPWVTASIQASTGYTTSASGHRVPSYAPAVSILTQRQSLQYNDIVQIQGLNIQGTRCKLYLNGSWNGVVRDDQKGGDLITLPDGTVWLCAMVLENWSAQDGWTSICCTLQNNS